MSGPNLMTTVFFLLVVFHDDLAHGLLEVERALLHLGVELTVDEDTGIEVLLGENAKILVLGHDSLVHVADEVELRVAGILVAVDLIAHHAFLGSKGSESLHEEKVRAE